MKDCFDELPARSQPTVAVVVLSAFSILELGAVFEPLSFVARKHPAYLTAIQLVGTCGGLASLNGLGLAKAWRISDLACRVTMGARFAAVFVCCGETVEGTERQDLLQLMRACRRQQIRLLVTRGAVDILADGGLLSDRSAAAHWAALDALRENHPQISFTDQLFVSTGHLTTCVGESAALDMTLAFLAEILPNEAITNVCARFMVGNARFGSERQPGSINALAERLPPALAAVVMAMHARLEEPLAMPELCRVSHLSQRQIERLFHRHLGVTPRAFYLGQRLDRARQLIRRGNLSLGEIAVATGFSGVSALTKRYFSRFKVTPSEERRVRQML